MKVTTFRIGLYCILNNREEQCAIMLSHDITVAFSFQ